MQNFVRFPGAGALRQAQGLRDIVTAMSWFVYILFCDQKTFYIGITVLE